MNPSRALGKVNRFEPEMRSRSAAELRALTAAYRGRLAAGETLHRLLPEVYATVREAARRSAGRRPSDGQVLAAAALHDGSIVDMQAGEGKSLACLLAACLNALPGGGVHVMTADDHLARRDATAARAVLEPLGLSVRRIDGGTAAGDRRAAYAADVTFGSWAQFGYDVLRDGIAWSHEEPVQRGLALAIVDDADIIVLDEAATPLELTADSDQDPPPYAEYAAVAARLERGGDYGVDEPRGRIDLTARGLRAAADLLGLDDPRDGPGLACLDEALRAKELFRRGRDYVVRDGEILVVDRETGRIYPGRRLKGRLSQASRPRRASRTAHQRGQTPAEYGNAAAALFAELWPRIKEEIVGYLFTLEAGA